MNNSDVNNISAPAGLESAGKESPCQSACRKCDVPVGNDGALANHPVGLGLVLAAAGTFLLPLATAVAGSVMAGGSDTRRLVGACAGLAVGLAAAILTAWVSRRLSRDAKRRRDDIFPAPADKENV